MKIVQTICLSMTLAFSTMAYACADANCEYVSKKAFAQLLTNDSLYAIPEIDIMSDTLCRAYLLTYNHGRYIIYYTVQNVAKDRVDWTVTKVVTLKDPEYEVYLDFDDD